MSFSRKLYRQKIKNAQGNNKIRTAWKYFQKQRKHKSRPIL